MPTRLRTDSRGQCPFSPGEGRRRSAARTRSARASRGHRALRGRRTRRASASPDPTERMTASQKGGPASAERGPHGARCESDRKRTRRPPAPHCRKVPHNGRCRGFIAARTAARSPVCRTCGKPRYRAQLRQRSGRRTVWLRARGASSGPVLHRCPPLRRQESRTAEATGIALRLSDRKGGPRYTAALLSAIERRRSVRSVADDAAAHRPRLPGIILTAIGPAWTSARHPSGSLAVRCELLWSYTNRDFRRSERVFPH